MDLARSTFARLTFEVAADGFPIWSPDSTRMAFHTFVQPLAGGLRQQLFKTPNNTIAQDWSKDGRFLLYYENSAKTARDVFAWDLNATEKQARRVVANTESEEKIAQFSPDGRWVAYETNQAGNFEIVVQAFPDPSGTRQVSTNGGTQPRWRPDGKELYFVAPDGKLMAVSVTASDSSFEPGIPMALFPARIVSGGSALFRPQYDVSNDGKFLINQPADESSPITIILNRKP
jgi:Tol biopolymer transport system component